MDLLTKTDTVAPTKKATAAKTAPAESPVITPEFRFVRTDRMSIDEWNDLPEHPNQRDTEKHARYSTHLNVFDPTHRRVTAATGPDGKMYVVDGHTRRWMWKQGFTKNLPVPLSLDVDLYSCPTRDALAQLYYRFDSRQAVETPQDIVFGTTKALGLDFKSSVMRSGRYGNALVVSYEYTHGRMFDKRNPDVIKDCVLYFKDELVLLDATSPVTADMPAAFMAAALLTLAYSPVHAKEFWTKYNRDEGRKIGRECDAVHAARNLLAWGKDQKKLGTAANYREIIGRVVNAFIAFRKYETYKGKSGIPNPKDDEALREFFIAVKRAKAERGFK